MSNLPILRDTFFASRSMRIASAFIIAFVFSWIKFRSRFYLFATSTLLVRFISEWCVDLHMLFSRYYSQIRDVIVRFVSVLMVDVFVTPQFSANALFHNKSMSENSPAIGSKLPVTSNMLAATTPLCIFSKKRIAMFSESTVVLITKSFTVWLFAAPLYFTQPLSNIFSRIHTQTVRLYGEIRKGLLSFTLIPQI